jgi:hypothetical protein
LLVGPETSLWWIRAIMFLRGASVSFAAVGAQAATFSTIRSEETARASALSNTNRQVAASVGVAVLSTALTEALALHGATPEGSLLAFHDAFAVSIAFVVVGILFAVRIHDQDAAAPLARPKSQPTQMTRVALPTETVGASR